MGCCTSSPAQAAASPITGLTFESNPNESTPQLPRPTILTQCQNRTTSATAGQDQQKSKQAGQEPKQAGLSASVGEPAVTVTDSPEVRESMVAGRVTFKVMTYNLFWWNLYGQRNGNNGSASKLIAAARPDIIGFQETDDVFRVLREGGMSGTYSALQEPRATAVAWDSTKWQLLSNGYGDVAEDQRQQYYGLRVATWARLQNWEIGKVVLFVNHHGPLTVNSGGQWGAEATANNIWNLIEQNRQPDDVVVLVGDFNSMRGTQTITILASRIPLRFTGTSFGGVDHIFTNTEVVSTQNLGPGGSDHDALMATLV
eukprot:CAMPEP_0206459352 /NCGR_PEP_ID=MMETSP0324_2-20121206/24124_1 /ASSEMBLY_ACC=CAM_ASM_000836 /TAXON_ID=2866 /ORGANISM="Crypthecodinium cohnii, Strain Seligo" /LENGTH=313 /DNA_ID=CAMNT_0053930885 /DNA_START=85 /DNA_END=1023 /DNA_ORIENTATION=+